MTPRIPRRLGGALLACALASTARGARADEPAPKPEGPPSLVAAVLPPGPWKQSLLFDINANVPKLGSRDFQIIGDAMLGWNAERWGVTARGFLYSYDVIRGSSAVEIDQREATVEGWGLFRLSSSLRLELRAVGFFSYFDSTRVGSGARLFFDETSMLGRGVALVALRYEPGTRGALGVWAGGGFQIEDYLPTTVTASGEVTPADITSVGGVVHARLRANYDFFPNIFGARLRSDFSLYSLQRDSEIFQVKGGGVTRTTSSSNATQVEVHTRLFLDAEVISFFGFVPGLNAGFDLLDVSTKDQGNLLTVVPNFGAGIRRQTF